MAMKLRLALLLGFLVLPAAWTPTQAQQLRDAYRNVSHSVVIVRIKQVELVPASGQVMSIVDGLGSGVLISGDGKILTAAHVVQAADKVWVEFSDEEVITAQVIGSDVAADVALLQLDRMPKTVAPAPLGDSDKVEVGDQIFAIGAPYGIGQTLTAGRVSGRRPSNKHTGNSMSAEFLQTDAAINEGNSGGPVFNMEGEVVGIVSRIMSRSGGSEGLAFAATSNTAKRLLLERKPFWSGIAGLLIKDDLAKALNLPQPAGFLVQRVASGSIAWRMGIQPGTLRVNVQGADLLLGGDIILSVNVVQITEDNSGYEAILKTISTLKTGEALDIRVFRQGQIVKLSIPIEP